MNALIINFGYLLLNTKNAFTFYIILSLTFLVKVLTRYHIMYELAYLVATA